MGFPNTTNCPQCGRKVVDVGAKEHMGNGWYDQIIECPDPECDYVDVNSYRATEETPVQPGLL